MHNRSLRSRLRVGWSTSTTTVRALFEMTMFGPRVARAVRPRRRPEAWTRGSIHGSGRGSGRGHGAGLLSAVAVLLVAMLTVVVAGTTDAGAAATSSASRPPVRLDVLSPRSEDVGGREGAGFVVDVALTARNRAGNELLSSAAGYRPFFNDPTAPTFLPGANVGAPGLVVMLSTTPDTPGSAFHGPRTNLAGLFQVNGVHTVKGKWQQTRNVWQIGKAGFGSGPATLTAYVVKGTAPGLIPEAGLERISNVVSVPFTISAPVSTAAAPATVQVARHATLGDILTDGAGRTLYLFEKDQGTTSACVGACATTWPALTADAAPTTGAGLDAAKIASHDGHVSYAGRLLYRYAGDQRPGDILGATIPSWAAVSPAGDAVRPG